jgi:hypothetical protein
LGLQTLEIKDQSRIIQLCITPFLLLHHPAVIWGCIMWSVTFTWVIIQGAVATQVFAAPPYNMSPTSIGNLVGIAPLIGAAVGTFFGGWACDAISKALALRNNGIYEPEFRLLVITPALVTMVIGGFGLGSAVHNGLPPITCGVFLGFVNFSVGVGCTGIVAYTNDVCQDKAGEAFGLAMVRTKFCLSFYMAFLTMFEVGQERLCIWPDIHVKQLLCHARAEDIFLHLDRTYSRCYAVNDSYVCLREKDAVVV